MSSAQRWALLACAGVLFGCSTGSSPDPSKGLGCWVPKSGWAISDVVARFGRRPTLRIEAEDHCPGNEVGARVSVWRDGDPPTLLTEEELEGSALSLELSLAGDVEAGAPVRVELEELFGDDAPVGAGGADTWVTAATEPMTGGGYVYRLEGSAQSADPGCHAQGVKFDGTHFYTACQDLDTHEARAFIHDSLGNQLCDFSLGEPYDHPGGLFLSEHGAYLGFSEHSLEDGSAVLLHISAEPCTLEILNGSVPFAGNISSVVAVPRDVCDRDSPTDHLLVYGSLGRSYWKCSPDGSSCGPAIDSDHGGILTALAEAPQDCDLYYDRGWLRACMAVSSVSNAAHVWSADDVDTDTTYWLANADGDTTVVVGGLANSGGLAFWPTERTAYVLLVPHDQAGDCGLRTPCTGPDRSQIVEFLPFERIPWPTGSCR